LATFEADEDTAQRASGKKQDQVLRYCDGGGGGPLWAVASGSLPAGAAAPLPPPCARCGGARRYEMQLMPQLLHYLHVEARDPDPLDWATVAVYTCARSCGGGGGGGGGYVEEFAWVQCSCFRRRRRGRLQRQGSGQVIDCSSLLRIVGDEAEEGSLPASLVTTLSGLYLWDSFKKKNKKLITG
jgi:pre-rRNA-processing protein TSR4